MDRSPLKKQLTVVRYSLVNVRNLVPRVSRARRDPGRVWSRASVTIENTREGSSLNKEFVAFVTFVALIPPNTASAKASNSSVAFLNRFLQCKTSLTEPHNLQQLMTDDVYVFFGVCKLLSPDIAAEEHVFTYRST